MKAPLASAMADMTANLFGWRVEGRYEILNEAVNRGWDWGSGRRRPEAMSELREALALDPEFSVSVLHGASDLVTPYFASKMLLDQLPATLGGRTRLVVTPGRAYVLHAGGLAPGDARGRTGAALAAARARRGDEALAIRAGDRSSLPGVIDAQGGKAPVVDAGFSWEIP